MFSIIIITIFSVAILLCIMFDSGLMATMLLSGLLLGAYLSGVFNIIYAIVSNPLHSFLYFGAYLLLGIIWMVIKWTLFVYKELDKAAEAMKTRKSYYPQIPAVSDHKSSLFRWLFWWPLSVVDTLLRDFVRKLFRLIYKYIKSFLQSISDKAFKDISAK